MKRYAIVSKKDDVSRHLAALIRDELGTLTVVDPHISKNVDYNVIFLSNF